MGLDEALDKSGQSGAGVEVHSESGDERAQEVRVNDKHKDAQEIKHDLANREPEKGGEEEHGR